MADSGATPKLSGEVWSRPDNQRVIITRDGGERGAAGKYEFKDPAKGRVAELNIMSGTLGPDVLDISHPPRDRGVFTYDPGFMATASTESKITYIDGDAGVLLYRGYPVEQLAEHSSHLEVADLLINGRLPTKAQHRVFRDSI